MSEEMKFVIFHEEEKEKDEEESQKQEEFKLSDVFISTYTNKLQNNKRELILRGKELYYKKGLSSAQNNFITFSIHSRI